SDPLGLFRETSGFDRGMIDTRLYNLGYNVEDAVRVAGAYGMPVGGDRDALQRDTIAALGLARSTGLDAGNIAESLRSLNLSGVMGTGDAQGTTRALKAAIDEGIRNGIDASTTLRNIAGLVEEGARSGAQGSQASLAYQLAL